MDKYSSTVQRTKLAQDSDVYCGSVFAEFSGSYLFSLSQLEVAHFCHCYHDEYSIEH